MKKFIKFSLFVIALLSFALSANAGKPVDNQGIPFGNGFPSGYHYNLNIIGKKDNFNCPQPEFVDGMQVYGNVIFIPRDQGNDPITILMESGKKGPRGAQNTEVLEVTDWCTESFPDFNTNKGDPAILRLPKNDKGYAVYARITGKPGDYGEPEASIVPELSYVEDEAGNDLILLGLVDRNGTATFSSDGMTLTRTSTDTSTKGKGVQKATNLTGNWSGDWKSSSGTRRGIISIDLTQSGTSVTGSASISGFSCMRDGNISGSFSGRNITFDIVSVSGTDIVSYSGKVSSPAMNGSYAVINWACALDHGTFNLTKQ